MRSRRQTNFFVVLRQIVLASSVLILTQAVFAQGTTTGAFKGEVVDEIPGSPLKDVNIKLTNENLDFVVRITSDERGSFTKGILPPGIYTIEFSSPGYKTRLVVQTLYAMSTTTIVPTPITLSPIELTAAYEGAVFDRFSENPIPGVRVRVRNKVFETQRTVYTDSRGRFFQGLLPPGDYTVEFSAPGYQVRSMEKRIPAPETPGLETPVGLGVILLTGTRDGKASSIVSAKSDPPKISFGNYYALIIGNDAYKEPIAPLKNAISDAVAVEIVLREKYGFQTKLLRNAKGSEIVGEINKYKRELTENDNLLIYYSGHGINDADESYWVPVDATDAQNNTNWVSSTIHIIKNFRTTKAKHILVISDSCFSGAIDLRDLSKKESEITAERERYLKTMVESQSRILMASGGNEPVLDGGGGKHSVFTKALLNGLDKMDNRIFTAAELFRTHIEQQVSGNSKQTPELKSLRDSGHEKGYFVFVRNK